MLTINWYDIRGSAYETTYGNGLSQLGGVLEAAGLLEDTGGGTGLDCLQSRSLSAQGGGKDTTRDHAELGYGDKRGELNIAPREVSRASIWRKQTGVGAEQPIRRRVALEHAKTVRYDQRRMTTTSACPRQAHALLHTISPQLSPHFNQITAKMADDEDRVTMPFKFVTGMFPP